MATNAKNPLRIITHGNNAFKSTELISQMEIPEENNLEEFEFFPFSDISLNNSSASFPNEEMFMLTKELYQGVEVSAILVLISLTEIFSEGMSTMIQKLPHSKFYGFNQRSEKEWWKHVIIVFSMGAMEERNDKQVMRSIEKNRGIKQIIKKAGNRYICMSESTEPGELVQKLRDVMQSMKEKLFLGGTRLLGYIEMVDSFIHCLNNGGGFRSEDIYQRFIIFGEKQSGKSSLANLLLGAPVFSTYWTKPAGRAKGFPISEADISELIVDGDKDTYSHESKRIQVVDQPESSNPKQYGEYLANCISGIKCSDPVTFLIAINFNSEPLSHDEFTKINDSSVILGIGGFDFYSNAIIVFTHVDDFANHSEDNLRKILEKKLQLEDHAFLKKLLKLVEQRYIFLNAINFGKTNRNEALRKILQITTQNKPDDQLKGVPNFNGQLEEIPKSYSRIIEENPKNESKIKGLEQEDQSNGSSVNDGNIANKIKELMATSDTPVEILSKEIGKLEGDIDNNSLEFLEKIRGLEKDTNNRWEYVCVVVKREKSNRVADTENKKNKNEDKSKEAFQTENQIKRDFKSENKSKGGMVKEDRNHVVNNKVATNGLIGLSQREKEKIPKNGNISELTKKFRSLENTHEQSPHVPSGINRRMSNRANTESEKNLENEAVRVLRLKSDRGANIGSREGRGNIKVDTSIQNISDMEELNIGKKNISFEIVEALKELSSVINTPIRIAMIHIREDFNKKIYASILKLAEINSTAGKKICDWQYTYIIFKLSFDDDEFVNKTIKENSYLRTLIEKVNYRYACVTERMSTDEFSRILKNLMGAKFQDESDCSREITEKPNDINPLKSVPVLFNSTNTTTEKEIKINKHIPFSFEEKSESIITQTNSMMLTSQKSEVPLLSYFSLDKMTAAGADERDGQDPGPQYSN